MVTGKAVKMAETTELFLAEVFALLAKLTVKKSALNSLRSSVASQV